MIASQSKAISNAWRMKNEPVTVDTLFQTEKFRSKIKQLSRGPASSLCKHPESARGRLEMVWVLHSLGVWVTCSQCKGGKRLAVLLVFVVFAVSAALNGSPSATPPCLGVSQLGAELCTNYGLNKSFLL